MIGKLLQQMRKTRHAERRAELYRNFIRHEARIGGTLFGPVPKGNRREFFCLDRHTRVWHEEYKDTDGQRRVKTTRYDVRPGAILKAQDGQPYQQVTPKEAARLFQAAKLYYQHVTEEIYNF
jgi:hypothetical protein